MANGATHTTVGALTGLAMVAVGNRGCVEVNPLFAIGTSTFFAKLPDIIEPAIHQPSALTLVKAGWFPPPGFRQNM